MGSSQHTSSHAWTRWRQSTASCLRMVLRPTSSTPARESSHWAMRAEQPRCSAVEATLDALWPLSPPCPSVCLHALLACAARKHAQAALQPLQGIARGDSSAWGADRTLSGSSTRTCQPREPTSLVDPLPAFHAHTAHALLLCVCVEQFPYCVCRHPCQPVRVHFCLLACPPGTRDEEHVGRRAAPRLGAGTSSCCSAASGGARGSAGGAGGERNGGNGSRVAGSNGEAAA